MTTVTVEEPKTVVDEVERYRCDQCKAIVDEDEINTQAIYDGDTMDFTGRPGESRIGEQKHLCDDCVGRGRYLTLEKMAEFKVSVANGISYLLTAFHLGMAFVIGVSLGAAYSIIRFSPEVADTSEMTAVDFGATVFVALVGSFLVAMAVAIGHDVGMEMMKE